MTLFLSTCFCASNFNVFNLFFDSGSLNFTSISFIIFFSSLIYFYHDKDKYLNEFSLIGNLVANDFLNICSNLFLHEIILLLDSLDFYQTFFILFVKCCRFFVQQWSSHIIIHSIFIIFLFIKGSVKSRCFFVGIINKSIFYDLKIKRKKNHHTLLIKIWSLKLNASI